MKILLKKDIIKRIVLLFIVGLISADYISASETTTSRPQIIRVSSCFDNSTDWTMYDWTKFADGFSDPGALDKIQKSYEQAKKLESEGKIKDALVLYYSANVSMKLTLPPAPFPPTQKALFRIDYLNLYPQEPPDVLTVSDEYENLGRRLICETLKRVYRSLHSSIPSDNKEMLEAINIAEANIDLMKDLVTYEKILIYSKKELGIIGRNQLEFWVKALLDKGIKFKEEQWEVFDPNTITYWQIENKGILKKRSFAYNSESFVPGIKAICQRAKIKPLNLEWDDLWTNVWEYCLISNEFEDLQSEAFADFAKGRVLEKLGQKREAIDCYIESARVNPGGYWEPVLALYDLNAIHPTEQKLASETSRRIKEIDRIRQNLAKCREKVITELPQSFEAAMFHSYSVRNIVLGRILMISLPNQRRIRINPSFQVVDMAFFNDWVKGMESFGLILQKNRLRVTPVVQESQIETLQPLKGFWLGCFADKDGNVFVPGIAYLRKHGAKE